MRRSSHLEVNFSLKFLTFDAKKSHFTSLFFAHGFYAKFAH